MPASPKTICSAPGCNRLIPTGTGGRCEQHKREREQRGIDKQRPTANKRGYNHRWTEASRKYRECNPLCLECQKQGIVKAAEAVDHIVPHGGDLEKFWDESNWQPICWSCHSRKTRKESATDATT